MKNIILLIILSIAFTNCKAQQTVPITTYNQGDNTNKYFKDIDNQFTPFLGTWEKAIGDITFRVILHKTTMKPMGYPTKYYMDAIEGSFLIIDNTGVDPLGQEIIIHNSVKTYSNGFTSTNVIYGNSSNGILLSGHINDNSADLDVLGGSLTMRILNTGSTPLQAHWKVFRKGMGIQGWNFNIPTDVILTKMD